MSVREDAWPANERRILWILLAVALARALLYAFVFVPPWQAPDEPGHYEYARLLADGGVGDRIQREALQARIIHALAEERFWERLGLPTPAPLPRLFAQDAYLNSQVEDEPAAYYLVPAVLMRFASGWRTQLLMGRAWSILLYLVVVGCVYAGLRELSAKDRFVPLVGGALAALLPMPAFIGSSFNNDVAAMALSAGALWLLTRSVQHGWSLRRLAILGGLLLLGVLTKKTTTFLWPAAGAAICLFRGRGARGWLGRHRQAVPMLALIALSTATIAWTWHTDGASGWVRARTYQLAERAKGSAHAGAYALSVPATAGSEPERLFQELSYNKAARYRGQNLVLHAWVSGRQGVGQGYLVIYDGQTLSRQPFKAEAGRWTRVEVRHTLAPGADRLGVVLANTGGSALAFDDLSLQATGQAQEILGNPDVERAAHWTEGWVARRLCISPGLVPHPLELDSYNGASWLRYLLYAALAFAGFWANFGWLTVNLAPGWYLLPLAAGLAAGVGLWRTARRHSGAWPAGWVLMAAALGLALLQTFLPMVGSAWQPQGRYLFPALLPIAGLLALGWRQLAPARMRPVLAGFIIASLVAFEQLCLWGYLIPRYAS